MPTARDHVAYGYCTTGESSKPFALQKLLSSSQRLNIRRVRGLLMSKLLALAAPLPPGVAMKTNFCLSASSRPASSMSAAFYFCGISPSCSIPLIITRLPSRYSASSYRERVHRVLYPCRHMIAIWNFKLRIGLRVLLDLAQTLWLWYVMNLSTYKHQSSSI